MNVDVLILFLNCILTTVISSVVVMFILRKQYKPAIQRLEREQEEQADYQDSKSVNG
ncbi:hypothetical protein MUN89_20895 [Halobacillus salinarum]|uniref:Uncharacterized protein n=1 Tax=Halobacillus salinarum TaxID=2932257 RepID=A0ABY4EJQ3_9BACI|nr:hypothetical protein [Halobacillus salinarum]UOQ44277.1 hypothetical protein MUN89_20895 [Halobacillus salinarum]